MKPLYSPKNIRSGQTFQATFGSPAAPAMQEHAQATQDDEDSSPVRRLLSLSFAPSIDHQITVHLTAPEGYLAEDVERKLEARYQHAGAVIDSSLYLAAVQAGIPAGVVVEIIRMFSYDVDFQRDVHEGDEFEVFFNRYFTPEGPARQGRRHSRRVDDLVRQEAPALSLRDVERRSRIFRRERAERQSDADEDTG
jgi:hypothetical protein